jgi:hypothetical protein
VRDAVTVAYYRTSRNQSMEVGKIFDTRRFPLPDTPSRTPCADSLASDAPQGHNDDMGGCCGRQSTDFAGVRSDVGSGVSEANPPIPEVSRRATLRLQLTEATCPTFERDLRRNCPLRLLPPAEIIRNQ